MKPWPVDSRLCSGASGPREMLLKDFFFYVLCWGDLNLFLQKHAGGDHISFEKMHRRGVKWYLLKEKKSIGICIVWQEYQTKYTVYGIFTKSVRSNSHWTTVPVLYIYLPTFHILVIKLTVPTSWEEISCVSSSVTSLLYCCNCSWSFQTAHNQLCCLLLLYCAFALQR